MDITLINKLKEFKSILREKYKTEEFAVFGSVAKGKDTQSSDVDIAILKMQIKSGFDIFRAKEFLKETLNKDVGLGIFNFMKTFIKKRIKKDFIYV